jgi:ATP synthase protein I
MGLDLAASVGVGVLLGWWIDRRYGTAPWWTLILATVGIVGGLLNFVRAGQRAARLAEREEREERGEREDGGGGES